MMNINYDKCDDFRCELRIAAINMCTVINSAYKKNVSKNYKLEKILKIIHKYLDEFRSPDFKSNIYFIIKIIEHEKEAYSQRTKHSFFSGVKIFKKKVVSPQEATSSIINMLYATDYLQIDSILILRNYLLNSPIANSHLCMCTLNKNPSNNLLSLFFSDYVLIDKILDLFKQISNKPKDFFSDIPLHEGNELILDNFDYICMIIYARYIILLLVFIISCDIT